MTVNKKINYHHTSIVNFSLLKEALKQLPNMEDEFIIFKARIVFSYI